ncbi:hypothetical protein ACP4OV_031163 [Aristida adscensionis]
MKFVSMEPSYVAAFACCRPGSSLHTGKQIGKLCIRQALLGSNQPTNGALRMEANMDALPFATTDICDANVNLLTSGELRSLQPIFQIYGKRRAFAGPVVTLKAFEDNGLACYFADQKGHGRILVIDGCGSKRCANAGGTLTNLAQSNGWAGIVVNGYIRDVDEINDCDIGVRALNSCPVRPDKKGAGERHVPLTIAGTTIYDGNWLYADSDGIVVASKKLAVTTYPHNDDLILARTIELVRNKLRMEEFQRN